MVIGLNSQAPQACTCGCNVFGQISGFDVDEHAASFQWGQQAGHRLGGVFRMRHSGDNGVGVLRQLAPPAERDAVFV